MSRSSQKYNSVFEKKISPFVQAGLVCVGGIVIMMGSWLIAKIGIWTTKDIFPWEIAFSGILFYAFFNAVFSLARKEEGYYFLHSLISYLCLTIVLGLAAWLFSGMTIDEAGSFRWILIIFTFSYLLIISIVGGMKKIVQLALRQEAAWKKESESD